MKISLWTIGKNNEPYVKSGIDEFTKRISRYFPVEWTIIPVPKNAGMLLQWLRPEDYLIALDEKGKQLSSEGLAQFLQSRSNESAKNIIFLIGGAFGLDNQVLSKAKFTWSLSSLTFPHQLVRLILAEQIYRACTILRNEKYHHK